MHVAPLLALTVLVLAGCTGHEGLRVGSTSSTQDSGLLDHLLPAFERDTGFRVRGIVAGTGEILEKARRGDVDCLLTHSPDRESAFVDEGHGLERREVMHNRFLLVGPPADHAGAHDAGNASDAMARIHEARAPFASRGDGSGTHDRELSLWRDAGLDASTFDSAWYLRTGSGQAATLRVADERRAYALTDEATWLHLVEQRRVPRLTESPIDDPRLTNTYAVTIVSGLRHPGIDQAACTAFADWLSGPRGVDAIRSFTIAGRAAFTPEAHSP